MTYSLPDETRSAHPYFMHDEVNAQPAALRVAIAEGEKAVSAWEPLLRSKRRVYTTGCGTSYHAALVAEHWLRALGVAPDARAVEGLELTTGAYSFRAPAVVIAFSQSGGKGATLSAVERAKGEGATVLAVTGEPSSVLAGNVDAVLMSGSEGVKSWAHTISYVAGLTAFLRLALGLADGEEKVGLLDELHRLPDAFAAFLRDDEPIRELAARYKTHQRIFLIGTGANFGTATEGELKLRETSYPAADAMNAEYFLHGPISSLNREALAIAVAPPGAARGRTIGVGCAARTIGAATLAIGEVGDVELAAASDYLIELPPLAEELTPLLYILPLQVFAYWRAVELGLNPDLLRRDVEAYLNARRGYDL